MSKTSETIPAETPVVQMADGKWRPAKPDEKTEWKLLYPITVERNDKGYIVMVPTPTMTYVVKAGSP